MAQVDALVSLRKEAKLRARGQVPSRRKATPEELSEVARVLATKGRAAGNKRLAELTAPRGADSAKRGRYPPGHPNHLPCRSSIIVELLGLGLGALSKPLKPKPRVKAD